MSQPIILMRGGGDLATGVALRLHRVGAQVVITELQQPLVVRRSVSFAEAIYRDVHTVEGVTARYASNYEHARKILTASEIPVLVDPSCRSIDRFNPLILIDARMTKRPPEIGMEAARFTIGLGPGFIAGKNCHAAIETMRGHFLARVIWDGAPQINTGIPEAVDQHQVERVLRAPIDGIFRPKMEIGNSVKMGELIAEVAGHPIIAPIDGCVRGLLHGGLSVWEGLKIGDIDPRDDARYVNSVSEKALAIGGGVLEAIFSQTDLRSYLWD